MQITFKGDSLCSRSLLDFIETIDMVKNLKMLSSIQVVGLTSVPKLHIPVHV